jgi:hypothetical protein
LEVRVGSLHFLGVEVHSLQFHSMRWKEMRFSQTEELRLGETRSSVSALCRSGEQRRLAQWPQLSPNFRKSLQSSASPTLCNALLVHIALVWIKNPHVTQGWRTRRIAPQVPQKGL